MKTALVQKPFGGSFVVRINSLRRIRFVIVHWRQKNVGIHDSYVPAFLDETYKPLPTR